MERPRPEKTHGAPASRKNTCSARVPRALSLMDSEARETRAIHLVAVQISDERFAQRTIAFCDQLLCLRSSQFALDHENGCFSTLV